MVLTFESRTCVPTFDYPRVQARLTEIKSANFSFSFSLFYEFISVFFFLEYCLFPAACFPPCYFPSFIDN